jgi:hypothetical protein
MSGGASVFAPRKSCFVRSPKWPAVRRDRYPGTVMLIVLVIVFALVVTIVAVAQLAQSGPLVHFAFYLFSGLLWILPVMGIIKWMMLPPRPSR